MKLPKVSAVFALANYILILRSYGKPTLEEEDGALIGFAIGTGDV